MNLVDMIQIDANGFLFSGQMKKLMKKTDITRCQKILESTLCAKGCQFWFTCDVGQKQ